MRVHIIPVMDHKETLTLQKSAGASVSEENRAVKGTRVGVELIQKNEGGETVTRHFLTDIT